MRATGVDFVLEWKWRGCSLGKAKVSVASRGGNPLTPWRTPVVREAMQLKKEALEEEDLRNSAAHSCDRCLFSAQFVAHCRPFV